MIKHLQVVIKQTLKHGHLLSCATLLLDYGAWIAKCLLFSVSHITPLLRFLHWLLVTPCIRFYTLLLTYKTDYCLSGGGYWTAVHHNLFNPPFLKVEGSHASVLFSVLVPGWWNELPLVVQTAETSNEEWRPNSLPALWLVSQDKCVYKLL